MLQDQQDGTPSALKKFAKSLALSGPSRVAPQHTNFPLVEREAPLSPIAGSPNTLNLKIQKRKEAAAKEMWKHLYKIFESDLDEFDLTMEDVLLAEPGDVCEVLDTLGYPYEGIIRRCLKLILENVSNPASPLGSYISSAASGQPPWSRGSTDGAWEVFPKISTVYRNGGDQLEQWIMAANKLKLESSFDLLLQSPPISPLA
uniref:Uncharacterized protein n=2 Tax=Eutreptiella gymnastica TaxID=73025 RepID=A0A7S1I0C3_9EUGL|mmetsp:Transcript_118796/g.206882  ORF Transcript_118796/g.206882 Transcript_118796/m.206882 type:complete len:202 (+) Transcript_118796:183-788(+)